MVGGALIAIAVMLPLLALHAGDSVVFTDFGQFDLRNVGNFLVLFTTVEAVMAALLAGLILCTAAGRNVHSRRYWQGLAAIFTYLALDETVKLRDSFNHVHGPTGKWFTVLEPVPWIWFYLPAAIVIAVLYVGFLARQPRPLAAGFVLGGVLYLAGLTGMAAADILAKGHEGMAHGGLDNLLIALLAQSLRIGGMLLTVHALLQHLERSGERFAITVAAAAFHERVPTVQNVTEPALHGTERNGGRRMG